MAKNLSVELKILANSQQANAELQKVQVSLDRMRSALARVGHYGSIAFAGWNIGSGVKQLIDMADSVKLVDARLRLVTKSTSEFLAAQKLSINVARQTGTSFESVATLYARLSQSGKDYGLTAERIGTITTATAQALKLSGASAEQSSAVITQLSQALGSDVLRGDEFNSIMENGFIRIGCRPRKTITHHG
jgi:tape measure domain